MKIAIATGNAHKVKELSELLNIEGVEFVSLKDLGFTGDIVEDGKTFSENAKIKAEFISKMYNIPAIADDSGLCVDALGGEPGIYSARYASIDGQNSSDSANIEKLLNNLNGVAKEKRTARFICSMAFSTPDIDSIALDGICEGYITEKVHGNGGFGYDPVFFSLDLDKTFGEASEEEKNKVSHRYNATKLLYGKLKDYVKEHNER